MVVKEKDILVMKVDAQSTKQGAEYAEKTWPVTFNRMGKADIYERMINIVKGIAAQKTIEDLLESKKIKYEKKDRKKWYETDRYDIFVQGTKYDIKTNRCDKAVFQNKKLLLDYSALVPTDQLFSRTLDDDDIYIFAFILYKQNKIYGYDPRNVLYRRPKDGEWIIHGFWRYEFLKPPKWTKEHGTENLGQIEISSSSQKDKNQRFLLGGTRSLREFGSEEVTLLGTNPKCVTDNEFFQLFFIRSLNGRIPNGKITIKCQNSDVPEIINPVGGFLTRRLEKKGLELIQNDWADIWLYDAYIYFVGYMTKGEFAEKSEEIKRFDKTVEQFETKVPNNRLYVHQLNPFGDLFKK